MYHFGYGSNLNLDFLRKYCPSAEFVKKAYLPNFEVQFRFWSEKRQGGISTIIEKPGSLVHGVIYEVPEEELLEMDIIESVPQGLYSRETFMVLDEYGEWEKGDLYRVTDPKGPFTPSRSYVELMLSGAKQHGLDPEYVKKIEVIYARSE
ncbi:MAG: gamma-glutamylcyclotransferase [Candidatus Bathyarchaeota archaeon]|nr:gamma-glutamylcyclotransferase [Candidatus Bathyarchaeota archaeon]